MIKITKYLCDRLESRGLIEFKTTKFSWHSSTDPHVIEVVSKYKNRRYFIWISNPKALEELSEKEGIIR